MEKLIQPHAAVSLPSSDRDDTAQRMAGAGDEEEDEEEEEEDDDDDSPRLGVEMSDDDEDDDDDDSDENDEGTVAKKAKREPIVARFEPGARTSRTTGKSVRCMALQEAKSKKQRTNVKSEATTDVQAPFSLTTQAVLWDGSKSKGGIARQLEEQATAGA